MQSCCCCKITNKKTNYTISQMKLKCNLLFNNVFIISVSPLPPKKKRDRNQEKGQQHCRIEGDTL